ncbi:hypothetical protein M514_05386 [Trichuris suis]|uniref:Uncharacterized protein n=1 Tax=Trichuris suis TaxID=68888 RepID=A0A085NSE7_9BILA|nr:hypothetical protein M513_05386 [Trichuris suis]KFD72393.1 hypothetical protein M514_05386 [Trichuris suis]
MVQVHYFRAFDGAGGSDEPVAVKIPKVEIPIGQNPDSRNPERSKSRMGQNPEGSKSRIGQSAL